MAAKKATDYISMEDVRNARIAKMKAELAKAAPAAPKAPAAPVIKEEITVGERLGKALACVKKGITGIGTSAGEFTDNVSTSYKFYSASK